MWNEDFYYHIQNHLVLNVSEGKTCHSSTSLNRALTTGCLLWQLNTCSWGCYTKNLAASQRELTICTETRK